MTIQDALKANRARAQELIRFLDPGHELEEELEALTKRRARLEAKIEALEYEIEDIDDEMQVLCGDLRSVQELPAEEAEAAEAELEDLNQEYRRMSRYLETTLATLA